MKRNILPILLVLALALLACSLNVNLPVVTSESGPVTTEEIRIPIPDTSGTVTLSLSFGAGKISIAPGGADLVNGTAVYSIKDLKPTVTTEDGTVHLEQGDYRLTGVPDLSNIKNEWDLQLGSVPMNLEIKGGAYSGEFALGGLALTNLTIEEGASKVELSFDKPNLTAMNLFKYQTGASNVSMTGLANANFTAMEFTGGAGNYTFDFSGKLQRDVSATIEAGLSNITLIIPAGIPVQVTVEGLSNVTVDPSWEKNGDVYTQTGTGPQLILLVELGAGNLTLTK